MTVILPHVMVRCRIHPTVMSQGSLYSLICGLEIERLIIHQPDVFFVGVSVKHEARR
jgi:hypothetical protein